MLTSDTCPATKGRCLALFPGAFRPPHQAHFNTVLSLVSRPEVDEVVVIITNRCRHVPGTTQALDVDSAQRIWAIYLQDIDRVRVEVAPHSAVQHALAYFDRIKSGGRLLFCAGESSLDQGYGRFSKIQDWSQRYGISACIIASPVPALVGGATRVRAHLARGEAGRAAFMAALPAHLSPAQCEQVWQICQQGRREMSDILKDRVRMTIEQNNLGTIARLDCAKAGKTDEVIRVELTNGQRLYVKDTQDTVKAARLAQAQSLKPRTRLAVERRALRWMAAHNPGKVDLPKVIHYQNKKTLVLSEVCPGGRTLEDDLKTGLFDADMAAKASYFLVRCHRTSEPVPPLGKTQAADLDHWHTLLDLYTTGIQSDRITPQIGRALETLQCASRKINQNGFFHLDYCPKNILMGERGMGVIDFELSANVGDPACDLGCLLGHYLFWGLSTVTGDDCRQAIQTVLRHYRNGVGEEGWPVIRARVVAFAGASIFRQWVSNDSIPTQTLENRLIDTASRLLAIGLDPVEEVEQILISGLSTALP